MKIIDLNLILLNPRMLKLVNLMKKDKKSDGDQIGFVLLTDIGKIAKTKNKKFFF